MRIRCNRWIQVLALVLSSALINANAQSVCYQYNPSTVGDTWFNDIGAADAEFQSICMASSQGCAGMTCTGGTYACRLLPGSNVPSVVNGSSYIQGHYTVQMYRISDDVQWAQGTVYYSHNVRENPTGCPDECETSAPAGTIRVLSASSADNWVSGEEACDANQCGWTLSSLYTTFMVTANGSNADQLWKTTATGQQCTPSQSSTTSIDADASTAEEECFTLEGIGEICVENDASAAPTINDATTEHTVADAGNCYATADGGTMCVQSSTADTPTAPPVPNDGTSTTTPAAPSVSTINNDNSVTNYYSSTTVNNQVSSSSSSSSSSGTNTGSDGDGGSEGGTGTGTGCQGSGCTSSGSGGDWYTKKTDTFGSVLSGFMASVQGSAIFTQATGFFTLTLGGSCPVWSTSVPVYGAIVIDQQCSSAMQGIWPYIYAVVVATAAFYAFRIAFL